MAVAFSTNLVIVDIHSYKDNPTSQNNTSIKTFNNTSHTKSIFAIDWSSDGVYLVSVSEDSFCLWETAHWRPLHSVPAQSKLTSCAILGSPVGSSDKNLRIALGEYEVINVWQYGTGAVGNFITVKAHDKAVTTALACGVRNDGLGPFLASGSGSKDNNLKIWRVV